LNLWWLGLESLGWRLDEASWHSVSNDLVLVRSDDMHDWSRHDLGLLQLREELLSALGPLDRNLDLLVHGSLLLLLQLGLSLGLLFVLVGQDVHLVVEAVDLLGDDDHLLLGLGCLQLLFELELLVTQFLQVLLVLFLCLLFLLFLELLQMTSLLGLLLKVLGKVSSLFDLDLLELTLLALLSPLLLEHGVGPGFEGLDHLLLLGLLHLELHFLLLVLLLVQLNDLFPLFNAVCVAFVGDLVL